MALLAHSQSKMLTQAGARSRARRCICPMAARFRRRAFAGIAR